MRIKIRTSKIKKVTKLRRTNQFKRKDYVFISDSEGYMEFPRSWVLTYTIKRSPRMEAQECTLVLKLP